MTFSVVFTPDQPQAAKEMLRVVRPNGKIGLANWTLNSFIGQLLKIIGGCVSPVPRVMSPNLSGHAGADRGTLRQRCAHHTLDDTNFVFRYCFEVY